MIRNISLVPLIATSVCIVAPIHANRMVANTKNALDSIRSAVLKEAKENKKLMKAPSFAIKAGIGLGIGKKYGPQTLPNAMIARPFFKVKGADHCLPHIGTAESDIAYIQSVFSEFYGTGERSMYRLITILHRHMMQELGLSITTSLETFRKIMENTNKHDIPKSFNTAQFDIYCRCVARGLYAVYWFESGQN